MGKLGSESRPAVARVKSQKRAEEVLSICSKHGWKVIIGIEPTKPEDISDVERLIDPQESAKAQIKTGRNDPCPCSSGNKYKKCYGK